MEEKPNSVRELLERLRADDRPFQPIADVIGAEAAEEVLSDFVRAVLARAGVPEARFAELAALTKLDCTPDGDAWVLKVECYGFGFEDDWDGTVEALQNTFDFRVRDIAGQIKADRNRHYAGHHPWDD